MLLLVTVEVTYMTMNNNGIIALGSRQSSYVTPTIPFNKHVLQNKEEVMRELYGEISFNPTARSRSNVCLSSIIGVEISHHPFPLLYTILING